jgi:hypothetical protein
MPFANPTYGGIPMFGLVTSFQATQNPTAQQIDAFFGVEGQLGLFGGARGHVFMIAGTFEEENIETLNADEAAIETFADGVARTLTDTRGRAWPNVIYKGEYAPDAMGPRPTDIGWASSYRLTMHGLT